MQNDPNDPNTWPQMFYVYSVVALAIAAGATKLVTLQLEAGSAFEWMQGTRAVVSGGAIITETDISTLQMVDQSSNANLFSQAAFTSAVFGTGELPFILPFTRMFAGNSAINISITNNNAAQADYYLNLIGRKIFGYTPAYNS